ncbi:MAG: hypothetical protein M3N23_03505, partial [Pseudomonadota bacterium]|nr:hypothetical protein [Pseudomonadota bacterium]
PASIGLIAREFKTSPTRAALSTSTEVPNVGKSRFNNITQICNVAHVVAVALKKCLGNCRASVFCLFVATARLEEQKTCKQLPAGFFLGLANAAQNATTARMATAAFCRLQFD